MSITINFMVNISIKSYCPLRINLATECANRKIIVSNEKNIIFLSDITFINQFYFCYILPQP